MDHIRIYSSTTSDQRVTEGIPSYSSLITGEEVRILEVLALNYIPYWACAGMNNENETKSKPRAGRMYKYYKCDKVNWKRILVLIVCD